MDEPHQRPAAVLRLVMQLSRSSEGRLEGCVRTDSRGTPAEFSGVLELLKVLEDVLVPIDSPGANDE